MLNELQTATLVERAREGEAGAFEDLVRAFLRPAYSVALAVVGRPADAEDVAQNALLLAFERIDTCREPSRFGSWLLQIVRNQGRNWLDRRRLRDVPASERQADEAWNGPPTDSTAHRDQLTRALNTLTPTQREVVLLHDLEGWTHSEISAALQISVLMSRQHLFHARQKLRERLENRRSVGGVS